MIISQVSYRTNGPLVLFLFIYLFFFSERENPIKSFRVAGKNRVSHDTGNTHILFFITHLLF